MRQGRKFKISRQNSDDTCRDAIQGNGSIQHAAISPEAVLPQAITEQSNFRRIGLILLASKVAPKHRLNPEGRQEG